MPKRKTNNLKWMGELLKLGETIDPETDRVVMGYPKVRNMKYNNIGVTATDKFTTKDTNKIVKKIEVRIDREIENNQKDYRVKVSGRIYDIERIYVKEEDRLMEVSLSYAN
ncbi:head-tail adaptor protein [Bacillus cereus group sp. N3]|uniref:head-tail adaptor protein n=1 Tax=Bacillus cereus group sp. N3 TaxID=2794582 RepID=UPI0018F73C58|nr:head-tail adaptor protein [Bacillus cereus group sp. N3]MBJ8128912.1 head-tail adaptor protein [Bacillus cereus group sp. N3]